MTRTTQTWVNGDQYREYLAKALATIDEQAKLILALAERCHGQSEVIRKMAEKQS